jgi:hypothetical protein
MVIWYIKTQIITERSAMNRKLTVYSIIVLTIVSLVSIQFAPVAAESQWIISYKIKDQQTDKLLVDYDAANGVNTQYAAILPGADIKISFTINVFTNGDGNLKLISGLSKSNAGKYWELNYSDFDLGSSYNPNSATAEFKWTQGELKMILYGKVPITTTTTSEKSINAVSLFGPTSGIAIDKITITATSPQMDTYKNLLNQKQAKLQTLITNGVTKGYIELYTNVLNNSQSLAESGDFDSAIRLLNSLDISNEPISSTMEMLFLPIVAVAAAIAAIFAILFIRVRGKMSYTQLVVEDEIKNLEGITVRVSKIDRTTSTNIDAVKDRLKESIGMD